MLSNSTPTSKTSSAMTCRRVNPGEMYSWKVSITSRRLKVSCLFVFKPDSSLSSRFVQLFAAYSCCSCFSNLSSRSLLSFFQQLVQLLFVQLFSAAYFLLHLFQQLVQLLHVQRFPAAYNSGCSFFSNLSSRSLFSFFSYSTWVLILLSQNHHLPTCFNTEYSWMKHRMACNIAGLSMPTKWHSISTFNYTFIQKSLRSFHQTQDFFVTRRYLHL